MAVKSMSGARVQLETFETSLYNVRGQTWNKRNKKTRGMAPGLYVKLGNDYGSLCGEPVSVLNEQLICGLTPTLA